MSASVLFDAPGPKTVARHRIYTVVSLVALVGLVAFAVWTLYDNGQLEYALWEPFVTPEYVRFILVDGLLKTLEMAFFSIIFAVVFGLVFGVAKLSDHALGARAGLARRGVLPRRAGAAADGLRCSTCSPSATARWTPSGAWSSP